MKLANRAFLLTILLMSLVLAATGQTLRPENDDRNIAPTVGTGGPVGGPTGLFTVYDGQTLRKGEFTFSIAYSNYDRDPGDVDITEVPVSFQVGLSDHVELFFNTDAYRGVKVNSPRNLSSFYLPNATFGSGPAIVLAPPGLLNNQFAGRAVFRPTGNQPFVFFPYVGGSAGTYGYPISGTNNPVLGAGVPSGAQASFPGIGSIYGSILPGVVLQTIIVNAIPQGGGPVIEVPQVYSTAPSYLPDAPFIGRTYGESAFSTFTAGAKIRFTGPTNPVGVGLIPFYRWYADRPSDSDGFTQLQRGASPGSKRGDFGLIGFADARVRKWMNISANVGYIYNGDVNADLPNSGDVTLLDRPDELIAAFGVDFPVNKYFQPIAEFRSLQYVGGRTPNAFENSPYDGLVGVRVFPNRWWGLGAAYRHHFNPQDVNSFDEEDTFNGTVVVPCFSIPGTPGVGQTTCQPQVIRTSFDGAPPGFRTSTDPHGFILQAWVGRRNERQAEVFNQFPTINSVDLSSETVTKPCAPGFQPREGVDCPDDQTVQIRTNASDPEGDVLTYNYTVTGGRIVGQGANVTWDLSGANPGTYTVTVAIDDGCGVCAEPQTRTVRVVECDCVKVCECPTLTVDGPASAVQPGETMTFTANVVGGNQQNITYSWEVSQGSIVSGQGTPQIVVGTDGLEDANVQATVTITGDEGCNCDRSASEIGVVAPEPDPELVDEFGPIPNNDVKARLDQFITRLANDPTSTGYIVNYGRASDVTRRERLIRDYMVNENGVDPSRLVFVNGGVEPTIRTRLWIVPAGADASTVNE